ncbi:M24 family metallopeptidase [Autumnicola musiva]|uniref:M24 family metallopeptidase n=1 Tax=Autumnicola musiva TaxID=3075589 RepID=A0ABU3DAG1_9FLAO|nr:M24 family metallopeptidase [Zunongwangia sp. F117]MDT0678523.1 M24 family metallopeptidase [Zunongwangia sp. F117]
MDKKFNSNIENSQLQKAPIYSLKERNRRWDLARQFMEQNGLEAMLIVGEHEDAGPASYSYDVWFTNSRPGSTVLLPKEGTPINLLPAPMFVLDHMEVGEDAWIPAKNIRIGRDSNAVVQAIKDLGLTKSEIGVIGLEPAIPWQPEGFVGYNYWANIKSKLPNSKFQSIGFEFAQLLMIQSEEEINVLKHAANIGETMVQAMFEIAKPGISEAEVYAAGMAAALSRGTVIPWMHMCSGKNNLRFGPPSWAYRPTPPRILEENDYIAAEVFCNYGDRSTQHQFALAIGDVDEERERAANVARDCYEKGLKIIKPETKFGEVAEALLAPLEDAGGWVRGPQIHGINPAIHIGRIPENYIQIPEMEKYPDIHEVPTLMPDMELLPGMSFVFEPSCAFGRNLVTVGGTILIDENGAVELNPSTGNLFRK